MKERLPHDAYIDFLPHRLDSFNIIRLARQLRRGGLSCRARGAAAQHDAGPAYGDAGSVEVDPRSTAFEGRRFFGLEHGVLAGVEVRFRTDAAQPAILDGGMACRVDDEG